MCHGYRWFVAKPGDDVESLQFETRHFYYEAAHNLRELIDLGGTHLMARREHQYGAAGGSFAWDN
jgi:hypothetical protein